MQPQDECSASSSLRKHAGQCPSASSSVTSAQKVQVCALLLLTIPAAAAMWLGLLAHIVFASLGAALALVTAILPLEPSRPHSCGTPKTGESLHDVSTCGVWACCGRAKMGAGQKFDQPQATFDWAKPSQESSQPHWKKCKYSLILLCPITVHAAAVFVVCFLYAALGLAAEGHAPSGRGSLLLTRADNCESAMLAQDQINSFRWVSMIFVPVCGVEGGDNSQLPIAGGPPIYSAAIIVLLLLTLATSMTARTLNEMLADLNHSFQQRYALERERLALLRWISHECRSPAAAALLVLDYLQEVNSQDQATAYSGNGSRTIASRIALPHAAARECSEPPSPPVAMHQTESQSLSQMPMRPKQSHQKMQHHQVPSSGQGQSHLPPRQPLPARVRTGEGFVQLRHLNSAGSSSLQPPTRIRTVASAQTQSPNRQLITAWGSMVFRQLSGTKGRSATDKEQDQGESLHSDTDDQAVESQAALSLATESVENICAVLDNMLRFLNASSSHWRQPGVHNEPSSARARSFWAQHCTLRPTAETVHSFDMHHLLLHAWHNSRVVLVGSGAGEAQGHFQERTAGTDVRASETHTFEPRTNTENPAAPMNAHHAQLMLRIGVQLDEVPCGGNELVGANAKFAAATCRNFASLLSLGAMMTIKVKSCASFATCMQAISTMLSNALKHGTPRASRPKLRPPALVRVTCVPFRRPDDVETPLHTGMFGTEWNQLPAHLEPSLQHVYHNWRESKSRSPNLSTQSMEIEGAIVVTVTDFGLGLSPGSLQSIFEPFRNVHSGFGGQNGSGLGLWLMRHLLHSQGGQLVADSGEEGKGAEFSIVIPASWVVEHSTASVGSSAATRNVEQPPASSVSSVKSWDVVRTGQHVETPRMDLEPGAGPHLAPASSLSSGSQEAHVSRGKGLTTTAALPTAPAIRSISWQMLDSNRDSEVSPSLLGGAGTEHAGLSNCTSWTDLSSPNGLAIRQPIGSEQATCTSDGSTNKDMAASVPDSLPACMNRAQSPQPPAQPFPGKKGHTTLEMFQHTTRHVAGFGSAFSEDVRLSGSGVHRASLPSNAERRTPSTKQKAAIVHLERHRLARASGKSSVSKASQPMVLQTPVRIPSHNHTMQWPNKILFVEDERTVRTLLSRQLRKCFHVPVKVAADGDQGLRAFQDALLAGDPFDLVVSDMSMPVMNGDEMVRHIRSSQGTSQRATVIAVTGNVLEDDARLLRSSGFDGILRKPASGKLIHETAVRLHRNSMHTE